MGEPQRQMMNKTTDEWANERNKKEKEKRTQSAVNQCVWQGEMLKETGLHNMTTYCLKLK